MARREIVKYTIERRSNREREMTDAFIMIDRHDRMRGAEVTAAIKKIDGVKACFVLSGGIENIANLDKVSAAAATLVIGAPQHKGGTGGPARIFALTRFAENRLSTPCHMGKSVERLDVSGKSS